MSSTDAITLETLPETLKNDDKVKLAGVYVDGILRGKLMSKRKFLSIASSGFGFCSVIFGWDMHDMTYSKELKISNQENGYRDMIAIPDLSTFRRIPWENNVPFFLVSFFDPDSMEPVCACPRGLLKKMLGRLEKKGYDAMAGGNSTCQHPDLHTYHIHSYTHIYTHVHTHMRLCARIDPVETFRLLT